MKFLVINGCSFSCVYDPPRSRTCVGLEIANRLGLEPVMLAANGSGNDRIIATTMEWVWNNGEQAKDSLFLIGWSSAGRFDYRTTKGTWSRFKPSEMDIKWYDEYATNLWRFAVQVISLQSFFEHRGLTYYMYNALKNPPVAAVNPRTFAMPDTSHQHFINKRGLHVSPEDLHPSDLGHRLWALELEKFICGGGLSPSCAG